MKLQNLQNYKAKSALEAETLKIILDNIEEGYEESFFRELKDYGCESGIINGLIFYSETLDFFNNNKVLIRKLLSNTLKEYGMKSPSELFKDKFDTNDMLCRGVLNQNLLAWFAFEKTTADIALCGGVL